MHYPSYVISPDQVPASEGGAGDMLPPDPLTGKRKQVCQKAILCCKVQDVYSLPPSQVQLYKGFIESKATRRLLSDEGGSSKKGTASSLSAITQLKKLCNREPLLSCHTFPLLATPLSEL